MEDVQCPQCGNDFECNAGNIANCQCADIVLTNAAKEYLSENYDSCLCRQCLLKLQVSAIDIQPT